MPPAGEFTITEHLRFGATVARAEVGEVFRWTSTLQEGGQGGARAAPLRPWTFGGQLRTSRTDYPGAKTPSEQVLGPHHVPFTLQGRFDDRYNFPGYAVQEMRRFEAMARRGNPVRIAFQNQSFEGLITEWSFDYHREWEIHYSFTVSVHDRPEDVDRSDRSPPTTQSASELLLVLRALIVALVDRQVVLQERAQVAGDLATRSATAVAAVAEAQDRLERSLDTREFGFEADSTLSPLRRLATQARTVKGEAANLLQELIQVRSDVNLGVQTALGVLDLEDWARSQRFFARVLLGQSLAAARELEERDDPGAVALYRPARGESLYQVSRRFYGTPFAWRLIAERNALQSTLLEGDELLVIPERGRG